MLCGFGSEINKQGLGVWMVVPPNPQDSDRKLQPHSGVSSIIMATNIRSISTLVGPRQVIDLFYLT